jgi:ABC-2 type transport system ATP-binding protein
LTELAASISSSIILPRAPLIRLEAIKEKPMEPVHVSHLAKSFGSTQAVADVSFSVERGEIFGLLGPNGAGKTTTIRIMLDILRADQGEVSVLGGPMSEAKKNRIGYLPEERGLYQDIPLERCLVYLATLKSLSEGEARRRVRAYLERFDLAQYADKKIKTLSKGMQQKAQLIATIAHQPELIIIDEPFSALDPVNTQMVKELMRALRDGGATILMCTHQMHQVEELCDRIMLIDRGRNVLYGGLDEIRRRYGGNAVEVEAVGTLPPLTGVDHIQVNSHTTTLALASRVTPLDVLRQLVEKNVAVERFEIALPSLEEIFVRVVREGTGHE